jgi:hypothetical protein
MAACCCSTVSLGCVREADAGLPIHSPKVLAIAKKMAKIRINSGNGSVAFFINRYLPPKATFSFWMAHFQIQWLRL